MTEYTNAPLHGGCESSSQHHSASDILISLHHAFEIIATQPDRDVLLQTTLDAAAAIVPADAVGIFILNPATHQWELVMPSLSDQHRALGQHIGSLLNHQHQPLVVPDLNDPRAAQLQDWAAPLCQAVAAVPLCDGSPQTQADDTLRGMLCIIQAQPYAFAEDELTALQMLSAQLGSALRQKERANRAALLMRWLDTLLQNVEDAIVITGSTGHIMLANPAARTLFALVPDDVGHRTLSDLSSPPELRHGLEAMRQHPNESQMTFDARLEDGRILSIVLASTLEVAASTTPDAPIAPANMMLIVRDMTRLRDAERARLNFIHSAAHDLRNPLGVTLGALSMLSKEIRQNGTDIQREIVDIGMHGIERMEKLINGLLNLEHIENEAGLSKTLVDVRELAERTIIDTRPLIESREQVFTMDIPDALPPITGDIHWLTRAVTQMLLNASQFTPAGGSITLRIFATTEAVYIEVEDTGPGIPPEAQATIFDPFVHARHTNAAATDPTGVGLGLAIVKAVVERHQGRLFVRSAPNAGSTFGIVLPVTAP